MNKICHDIFKAIHEGKWLRIEYCNQKDEITKFWIGIRDINVRERFLVTDGLHVGRYTVCEDMKIYIDNIISSEVVDGSYFAINSELVEDIYLNPHKYQNIFSNTANLKILNYLEMCNRMDTTPYYSDFALIKKLDRDSFNGNDFPLSHEQFCEIIKNFQYKMENGNNNQSQIRIKQLAMNVLSINTNKGLYVLAYRKLQLDVKRKVLRPSEDISICTEYIIGEQKESIRRFLDAEEYELLNDFEKNQEKIKDCITKNYSQTASIDDMPYIIGIGMDIVLDLHKEYQSIISLYHQEKPLDTLRAFFGDLVAKPRRIKEYPMALIDDNINLDQLLAINNGMKYPLAYIQGPPGTGKTSTIINTIITAFFNEKTVLFTSYNNHPINGVFKKLSTMTYKGKTIPFPVLRLGNVDVMKESLIYIKELYKRIENIQVFEETLDKRKDSRIEKAKKLSELLKKYEEYLELKDREEAIVQLINHQRKKEVPKHMYPFQIDLYERQLQDVKNKKVELGKFDDEQIKNLLDTDYEQFKQYLYYTSASYIKKLSRNRELYRIIFEEEEKTQLESFTKYLRKTENVKKVQRIFPVIITTCISAHKLGEPKPIFDMVIMDEASQCNTAIALVPIIRGENLMLVGDPQQLNPVILLDEITNQKLREKYKVSEEYDYCKNSVYKTFLACDSVSDEVLLRNHYRCNKKIIQFNNKKYYNEKLKLQSQSSEKQPLVYMDVKNISTDMYNTAPAEAEAIIEFAITNKEKSIGVITPFVNQKKLVEEYIKKYNLTNISCGTVHAFQGDEKDVVLFSTALTNSTQIGTYHWLKNNKELINVATSRARDKLVVMVDSENLARLHEKDSDDDFYELVQYAKKNGESVVTKKQTNSRALGIKPFSTATEEAFLENLTHALGNIWITSNRYAIKKEVPISAVFEQNMVHNDLFYTGRFDFVIFVREGKEELPVLAIELDGKEHFTDDVVKARDAKKNEICQQHNFQIIRVENSYARRYNHIKEILMNYFSIKH